MGNFSYCIFGSITNFKIFHIKKYTRKRVLKHINFSLGSFIIFILSAGLFFSSCKKNELIDKGGSTSNTDGSAKIYKFNDFEEYESALKELNDYTIEDVKEWSRKENFYSLGLESMEFYREVNPNDFKSKKEIIDFAERNDNMVYFYLDKGEKTIEPALMFHIERFFVNKDRIFMIGDNAIKLFPEGKAIVNKDNIKLLKALDEINPNDLDPRINYFPIYERQSEKRDANYNCGTYEVARETNGNNRTKIELTAGCVDLGGGGLTNGRKCSTGYLFRPYKRTLGIWFHCTRTLDAELNIIQGTYNCDNSQWEREYAPYKRWHPRSRSVIQGSNYTVMWSSIGYYCGSTHYDAWFATANTPDTDRVEIWCNAGQLPW